MKKGKLYYFGITLLVVAIVCSLLLGAYAIGGADAQPSEWAAADVTRAMFLGLVPASLQSNYNEPMTRAQFCAVAVNVYETATGKIISLRRNFNDTDSISVQKMGGLEIVSGEGDNQFCPNDRLTREQAAVILSRLMAKMDVQLNYEPADFSDNEEISDWALEAVGHMKAMGIMNGTGDNLFSPQDYYTIEQGIVTLLKAYDLGIAAKLDGFVDIFDENVPLASFKDIENAQYVEKIAELVNKERADAGLDGLATAEVLNAAAAVRAVELEELFSHIRPDGRDCFTVFSDFNITYKLKGENLGMKYVSPEKCVEGWMNSEAHRTNMLKAEYKKVGVGVHKDSDGALYWVLLLAD